MILKKLNTDDSNELFRKMKVKEYQGVLYITWLNKYSSR